MSGKFVAVSLCAVLGCGCDRHDVWQLGGLRVITRSHVYASATSPEAQAKQLDGAEAAPKGMVLRAKMEYQGSTEGEAEEVTLQEQAAWWLALKLRPGCCLKVLSLTAAPGQELIHCPCNIAVVREQVAP